MSIWTQAIRPFLIAAAVTLAACGGASNIDICHASCDLGRRCNALSEGAAVDCHNGCTNNRGRLQDEENNDNRNCTNAGHIRSQILSCLNSTSNCNAVVTCPAQADRCISP